METCYVAAVFNPTELDKASRTWTNQFAAAMLTISLNNASATQEFGRLGAELGELELWAAAIEGKPEEKLIKELEQKVGAMGGGLLHGRGGVYMVHCSSRLEKPMMWLMMVYCSVGWVFTWYPGRPFWRHPC